MEELIRTSTSGRIAGLIAEPIQGVGGFYHSAERIFPHRGEDRPQLRRHLHQR